MRHWWDTIKMAQMSPTQRSKSSCRSPAGVRFASQGRWLFRFVHRGQYTPATPSTTTSGIAKIMGISSDKAKSVILLQDGLLRGVIK